MENLNEDYKNFRDLGVSADDARMILPNACLTVIEVGMNLRELINFCGLRLCSRASWEIREVANQIKKLVVKVLPDAEIMLVPKCERNPELPMCTEHQSCGKHPTVGYYKDIEDNLEQLKDSLSN